MKKKKILILLPDGVGLRNFAFTSFVSIGEKLGWDVIFWNLTSFNLGAIGHKEVRQVPTPSAYSDLLKRAKIKGELDYFEKKFGEPVFQSYDFPPSTRGIKNKIKNKIVRKLVEWHKGEKGLNLLREKLKRSERGSKFYRDCILLLNTEKPDFVFCTNQRPLNAISPLTAAEDLQIPTATFIFSWDNLPKATMVVEPNYYFVWSEYMKQELQKYYPHIEEEQIKTTGTPQFEPHYDISLREEKEKFYKKYELDLSRKYLCFSGDDVTTSPHDEHYLQDVAAAVRKFNSEGAQLGVVFRRCPTDFSDRYDSVLEEFPDVIVPIEPLWVRKGGNWNQVLPTKEDLKLQVNVIQHTFMVINVASSMVFDYAAFNKICAYINYNPEQVSLQKDVKSIYNYLHFRSMCHEDSVLWINSKNDISSIIKAASKSDHSEVVREAKKWFGKINRFPPQAASERIWRGIEEIV